MNGQRVCSERAAGGPAWRASIRPAFTQPPVCRRLDPVITSLQPPWTGFPTDRPCLSLFVAGAQAGPG